MNSIIPVHQSILKKFAEKAIPLSVSLIDEKGLPISYVEVFGSEALTEKALLATLTIDGSDIPNIPLTIDL